MESLGVVKIKLDENLSRHLKASIAQLGHDARTAEEEGLLAKSDVHVGSVAKSEGRMVFTLDLDFADLRKFPPGSHPGVVLFRPRSMGPLAMNGFILKFAQDTDLSELIGCVAVVEPHRIRVRRPSINTETSEWDELPIK